MRASSVVVVVVVAVASWLVACGDNIKPAVPDVVPLTCGNGIVDHDAGELCDTGIASGPGACPTACDDGAACTEDVLSGSACTAVCVHASITAPAADDGCCPPGADANTDGDCTAICGNGVQEPTETCDVGITSSPGACPVTCDDGIACTADTLGNPGTCQAVCLSPPITAPTHGDGCCPSGANANTDNDCAPVCGNAIPEPGEQCDDGNTNNKDACANNCTAKPGAVAFRFAELDLRDPHVHVATSSCKDVTDNALLGFSINDELKSAIQQDGNSDGLLDLSPTLVFRQFSQTAVTTPVELHFARCTAPTGSSSCTASGGAVTMATATNQSAGQCLTFLPGTVRPYKPAITPTSASCFVTDPVAMTLDLGGIMLPLRDAQLAAHYVGFPADVMAEGLLRGFISEADASTTIIPASFPLIGGQPLSALLAGGTGACSSSSDMDVNNGVVGWWFYLSYSTNRVTWVE